jgi:hypothetical protein
MRITFISGRKNSRSTSVERVKAQRWRNQINERRRGLQLDSGEITVTGEIASLLMAADSRPIVSCLQGQIQSFGGLQFQNGEAAEAGDAKKIQDSVLRGALRNTCSDTCSGRSETSTRVTSC